MKSFKQYIIEKTRTDPKEEFFRLKHRWINSDNERISRNLPKQSPYFNKKSSRLIGAGEAASSAWHGTNSAFMAQAKGPLRPEVFKGFAGTGKRLNSLRLKPLLQQENTLGH